jgi:3-oxoacyl-[acyl-carrier protein] reductase
MAPTLSHAGEWIFVAGAAGLVGRAVSAALAGQGANLVLHGRAAPPPPAGGAGRSIRVHGDLTEPGQVAQIRDRLRAEGLSRLDTVINCTTGFDGQPVPLADLPAKEFRRVVDIDLVGSFILVKELLPLLRGPHHARVVLLSSLAAVHGRPGAAHLCAAKAGLHGLVRAMTIDLARDNVVVHLVAPGPIGHPPGSTGVPSSTPGEVADVITLLTSAQAGPLSGQVLRLAATAS